MNRILGNIYKIWTTVQYLRMSMHIPHGDRSKFTIFIKKMFVKKRMFKTFKRTQNDSQLPARLRDAKNELISFISPAPLQTNIRNPT